MRASDIAPTPSVAAAPAATTARRKATNKEQQERETLPARIDALEAEQRRLETAVAAPDFYLKPAGEIAAADVDVDPAREARVLGAKHRRTVGDADVGQECGFKPGRKGVAVYRRDHRLEDVDLTRVPAGAGRVV